MQLLTTLLFATASLGDPNPLGAKTAFDLRRHGACEAGLWLDDLEERVRVLESKRAKVPDTGFGAAVCFDVASDFRPIHPTRSLPSGVRELSVAIESAEAAPYREIEAVFVAVDVGDAAPAGTEMARSRQPTASENPVRFRYHQERPLPPGSYRVDLARDGQAWRSLPFRVEVSDGDSAPIAFPLVPGKTWIYDFVQTTGDKDGGNALRAVVEIRVADATDDGAHVEIRRDGAVVTEEWWRFEENGLVATRRTSDGETYELAPPQPLLASTPGASAWEWTCPQLGVAQRCGQWGPVDLSGPWGRAQGIVVRTEQEDGGLVHTVEREFAAGIGLVRERITTARGGHRVATQELVLRRS